MKIFLFPLFVKFSSGHTKYCNFLCCIHKVRRRCEIEQDTLLEQLQAFVSAPPNDAVALAFADEAVSRQSIRRMNLLALSEFKRTDKGFEVKLLDRIRLAELLLSATQNQVSGAEQLLEALGHEL